MSFLVGAASKIHLPFPFNQSDAYYQKQLVEGLEKLGHRAHEEDQPERLLYASAAIALEMYHKPLNELWSKIDAQRVVLTTSQEPSDAPKRTDKKLEQLFVYPWGDAAVAADQDVDVMQSTSAKATTVNNDCKSNEGFTDHQVL